MDYALISSFSRLLYNFDEKYLFSATIRRDGSSNFGENNRYGVFPSASVGWVASKEDFLKDSDKVSFMKVRASWGVNGSDRISPLSYVARIQNAFTYSFGSDEQTLNTGTALAAPPNPNVKWEQSEQIDIGVELGLFDNKLNIEADVYSKRTKDLLMTQQIPGYIGATNNPTSNLGEILNRGIEMGIGYRMSQGDWDLNTQLNYTHFKNEVINVAGETGYLNGWGWPVRNTAITRMTEGYAVGHFVGIPSRLASSRASRRSSATSTPKATCSSPMRSPATSGSWTPMATASSTPMTSAISAALGPSTSLA